MKKHPRILINHSIDAVMNHIKELNEALGHQVEQKTFHMMKAFVLNGGDLGDIGVMVTNDDTLFEGQLTDEQQYAMNVMMFSVVLLDDAGQAVENLYAMVLDTAAGTIYAEQPYEPTLPASATPTVH